MNCQTQLAKQWDKSGQGISLAMLGKYKKRERSLRFIRWLRSRFNCGEVFKITPFLAAYGWLMRWIEI